TLMQLQLQSNQLTGPLTAPDVTFPNLQYLSLDNNQFTGKVEWNEIWRQFPNLEGLYLSWNNISGALNWSQFPPGKPLWYLDIRNNNFSGTLEFEGMPSTLSLFRVDGNGFIGDLNLTALYVWLIHANRLSPSERYFSFTNIPFTTVIWPSNGSLITYGYDHKTQMPDAVIEIDKSLKCIVDNNDNTDCRDTFLSCGNSQSSSLMIHWGYTKCRCKCVYSVSLLVWLYSSSKELLINATQRVPKIVYNSLVSANNDLF
ncbi:kinase, partial [Reticulomyxa filosa]